jgi:MFS family permease
MITLLFGTTLLPAASGYVAIVSGIALFVLFCFIEETVKHPIFKIDLLLKNRRFAMANIAALLNFSAAFSVPFLLSLYLQYVKNMEPHTAGLVLLTSALTLVIGSPLAGKLSDSIDPKILASLGMAIASAALLIMSFMIHQTTPLYVIVLLLFIFGVGYSLFASPNTNAAMGSVSKRQLGIASSILGTMRMFGQTMSMGITMLVLSLFVGKVAISGNNIPHFIKSAQVTFFIFGALCACGIFASLARGKHTEPAPEEETKVIVE